jgi:hypothetical protein
MFDAADGVASMMMVLVLVEERADEPLLGLRKIVCPLVSCPSGHGGVLALPTRTRNPQSIIC